MASSTPLFFEDGPGSPAKSRPRASALQNWFSQQIKGPDAQGNWGNWAISYSLTALAIALSFLQANDSVFDPPPQWAKSLLQAAAFVGTLLGMIVGGYLCDVLGRRTNMLVAQSLVIIGVVGTAIGPWGSVNAVYGVIILFRVLMGVGIGATYPSAFGSIADSHDSELEGNHRIGMAYLNQTWAALAPYLLGWALSAAPPPEDKTTVAVPFRVILAVGAIFAVLTFAAAYYRQESRPASAVAADHDGMNSINDSGAAIAKKDGLSLKPASIESRGLVAKWRAFTAWASLPTSKTHLWHLVGTCVSWFCFDACYYSVALFLPSLLTSVFGKDNSVAATCWQSSILVSIGAPATIAALFFMRRFGPRSLNVWGFVLLAVVFATLGILYSLFESTQPAAKFAVYCCLAFALSWGPSVGVHVMASSTFPYEIRGRFIGISAASGKFGALLGSLLFSQIQQSWDTKGLMFVEVAIAIVGAVVSLFFLPRGATQGEDIKHAGLLKLTKGEEREEEEEVEVGGTSGKGTAGKPLLAHHA